MLSHPGIFSRVDEVYPIFETLAKAAESKEFVELSDFTSLIIKRSKAKYNKEYTDDDEVLSNKSNKFKGDLFEIFAEIYFTLVKSKNSSGVINYRPLHSDSDEDYGVDGTGINYSGYPSVVQVKFRSNPLNLISYSALSNTYHQAKTDRLIPMNIDDQRRTLILFTNCNGENQQAKKRFSIDGELFVINKDVISSEVDGNVLFWQDAFQLIKEAIESKQIIE